jgi:hypothetical protein
MNREVHVRFWESAGLRCPAPLTYLRAYATGSEARLGSWIAGYNTTHQALGYRTPDEVYKSPPVAGLAPTPIGVAA